MSRCIRQCGSVSWSPPGRLSANCRRGKLCGVGPPERTMWTAGALGQHAGPAQAAARLTGHTVEIMTVASHTHRNHPTRFGLQTALPRGTDFGDFAVSVQDAGFDVLTIPDHLVWSLSPFAGAAAAAGATQRLHVRTLGLNNDFRHPVDTARETATIASVSGGRFELGLGAGHMKSEYDAAGIPFDSA